jgi:hypothetical protein
MLGLSTTTLFNKASNKVPCTNFLFILFHEFRDYQDFLRDGCLGEEQWGSNHPWIMNIHDSKFLHPRLQAPQAINILLHINNEPVQYLFMTFNAKPLIVGQEVLQKCDAVFVGFH